MPLFQGVELRIDSGSAGTTKMTVERLQSVNTSFDISRADIRTLNRFRPDINRPVINYTPVNLSFDVIKSDSSIENALGLTNPTGVLCGLTNSKSIAGYGVRNFELLLSPLESVNYIGQFNAQSGVLNNYSVSVSVGDTAKQSLSYQFLDIGFAANNSSKTGVMYTTTVVRGQDASITGIDFSGFGVSGMTIQSMSLAFGLSRVESNQIGSKFPVERPIVDASATLQIQGFIEGGNTSLTGLGIYDCGTPANGSLYVTLRPSCGGGSATSYRLINPYLQSMNINSAVGSFMSVDMSFSIPLPIGSNETGSASNLIIS